MNNEEKILQILGELQRGQSAANDRFDKMDDRFDKMEARQDRTETLLEQMQLDVRAVKVTLENEVKRDISLIRESQIDQARHTEDLCEQVGSIEKKLESSVIIKAVTP